MDNHFKIGLAGLGTVGCGVVKLLNDNHDLIQARTGISIQVKAISARDKNKDRGVDFGKMTWVDNPVDLASNDNLHAIIELMGGDGGVAKDLVEAALSSQKPVVTANKALMAKHGYNLAQLAEDNNTSIFYEAAIAGGIPIVKSLKEGLASNKVDSVAGILNGTCNYILTEMEETGADFNDVLSIAQDKGYAEADPSFDIDGVDAAHKISLLASLAYGTKPAFDQVDITGIRHITLEDVRNAQTLGYKIKLLAIAEMTDDGLLQRVEPCFVPLEHSLASVSGVLNAAYVTADYAHNYFAVGPGAGQEPTASAVVSDIIDCALGVNRPVFGLPANLLKEPIIKPTKAMKKRFYMRLPVLDKAGVLSDISTILKNFDVSIETLIQVGHDPDQPVTIMITTHETTADHIHQISQHIRDLPSSIAEPCIIPIEAI